MRTHSLDGPLSARTLARMIAMSGLIAGLLACAESTPAGPTDPPLAQLPPTVQPPGARPDAPDFPVPSRPAHVYQETDSLYSFAYAYHGGVLKSRYILYDDGTFSLQFSSLSRGLFEYLGTYARTGSEIAFYFKDADLAGPWDATATLNGTLMRVYYNSIMIGADFNNGVYVESSAAP